MISSEYLPGPGCAVIRALLIRSWLISDQLWWRERPSCRQNRMRIDQKCADRLRHVVVGSLLSLSATSSVASADRFKLVDKPHGVGLCLCNSSKRRIKACVRLLKLKCAPCGLMTPLPLLPFTWFSSVHQSRNDRCASCSSPAAASRQSAWQPGRSWSAFISAASLRVLGLLFKHRVCCQTPFV